MGLAEIIVILIILGLLTALVVGIVLFVVFFSKRSNTTQPVPGPKSIEDRLSELDALRAKDLISDMEHQEKRRQILDGV